MNTLQYVMLGLCAIMVAVSPLLIRKAIRQKQRYRLFEIPFSVLTFGCAAVYIGWPNALDALHTASPFVHYLVIVLLAVWIAEFFGIVRWLFSRQKAAPSERR